MIFVKHFAGNFSTAIVEARNLKMNEFDTESPKPSLRQKKMKDKPQHLQSSSLSPDENSNENNQNKKINTVTFEKQRKTVEKTPSLHTKSKYVAHDLLS